METYHKIQTVFKRDPKTNHKTLLEGQFSLPEFDYLKDNEWVFTEKVDGTNVRVMWDGETIKFGGKSDNAQMPMPLMEALGDMFKDCALFVEVFGGHDYDPAVAIVDVCLYGEGYGGKIQKGSKYRPDQSFVLFDVKIGELWLQRDDVIDIAGKLGCDVVPIIGRGDLSQMVEMCRSVFESAWSDEPYTDSFPAEGIVARPSTEMRTRRGDRMITKLKLKDFAF